MTSASVPSVVLDTNVVLSSLVFTGETAGAVRKGWQDGRFVPLASTATSRELLRALAYPKFGLSAAEQADLLADYLPWVRVIRIPDPPPAVPACRDPHDRPFLELAAAARARVLVSGDRDLLALGRVSAACPILDLAAFSRRYLGV